MSENEIGKSVEAFFVERGKGDVAADVDIFEAGLIDSMELLELLMYLEETLGVEMPQDVMTADNFRTIETITNTIVRAQSPG